MVARALPPPAPPVSGFSLGAPDEENKNIFTLSIRRVAVMVPVSMEMVLVTVAMSVADGKEERETSELY